MQKILENEIEVNEKAAIKQLVVFRVGDEEFGIPIDYVREIIKTDAITPIPNAPEYIKGIVNVRGDIVTAIDLKIKFNLTEKSPSEQKHIVVIKQAEGLFGLIVKEVEEVMRVSEQEIKSTPSMVKQVNKRYVSGIITRDNRLIILLDLSRLFSAKIKHKE